MIKSRKYKKMRIDHYSFGQIVIDGKRYTSDVIIYPGRVDSSWWREDGHTLRAVDIADVIDAKPEILIIGTGIYGAMSVPKETLTFLESKGMDIRIERTEKAVELFNKLQGKKVIAVLHINC